MRARSVAVLIALLYVFTVVFVVASPSEAWNHKARHRVVEIARHHTGIPYRWGGTSHYGVDCSGFTQHVFRNAGYYIPRTSYAQSHYYPHTYRVSWSKARRGDLVYWRQGHVAVNVGRWNNRWHVAESSRPGTRSHIRALRPRWSSWDRYAIPYRVRYDRLHHYRR